MRRLIARKRVSAIRAEQTSAAMKVQRKYRQWVASRAFGERLWDREIGYRESCIHRVASAVTWTEDELVKMAKRLSRTRVMKKTETLVNETYAEQRGIFELQQDIVEIRRQVETVSPRSQQMGWTLHLAEDLRGLRSRLTDMKLNFVMGSLSELAKFDNTLETSVDEIESVVRQRNKLSRWRTAEERRLYDIVYERRARSKEKSRITRIAEEKRKWRVVHYTPNGKRIKFNRSGRYDLHLVSKGLDKVSYSAGCDVDLLANSQLASNLHGDVSVSVNQTISRYSLQVYLDQISLYEKLLNPITDILSSYISKDQTAKGYGAEGWQIFGALVNIGAISDANTPPMPRELKRMDPQTQLASQKLSSRVNLPTVATTAEERIDASTSSFFSDLNISMVSDSYADDDSATSSSATSRLRSNPLRYDRLPSGYTVDTLKSSKSDFSSGLRNDQTGFKKDSNATSKIPWDILDGLEVETKKFKESKVQTKHSFQFHK